MCQSKRDNLLNRVFLNQSFGHFNVIGHVSDGVLLERKNSFGSGGVYGHRLWSRVEEISGEEVVLKACHESSQLFAEDFKKQLRTLFLWLCLIGLALNVHSYI